jgi:hypothetical protein
MAVDVVPFVMDVVVLFLPVMAIIILVCHVDNLDVVVFVRARENVPARIISIQVICQVLLWS